MAASASLLLKIGDVVYDVVRTKTDPIGARFRHIHLNAPGGPDLGVCVSEAYRTFICSCRVTRHLQQAGHCEHTRALREVGLLPRRLRPLHAPADREEGPTEADLAEAHEAGRGTWGGEDPLW
jgi:hypothetical protein